MVHVRLPTVMRRVDFCLVPSASSLPGSWSPRAMHIFADLAQVDSVRARAACVVPMYRVVESVPGERTFLIRLCTIRSPLTDSPQLLGFSDSFIVARVFVICVPAWGGRSSQGVAVRAKGAMKTSRPVDARLWAAGEDPGLQSELKGEYTRLYGDCHEHVARFEVRSPLGDQQRTRVNMIQNIKYIIISVTCVRRVSLLFSQ